ncbi:TadE/TadG family type IV pilus assembly protein [Rhizorhapis sp. SPR117]|uniref:TadE/TadG family type IV pilus assembly protein n=1 Tax=Rhizorhapis sp. SPR117 TaxID=2912611 RepID=UPI001F1BC9DF|nr:Tad domain-containing protein [Rhizorhapis sp. SPR117]
MSKKWKILRNQSGNALFIATLAMPVLIGAGGLATDTIQWTLWKRQIQRQADSAALSGAYAKAQGGNPSASATAEINRHSFVTFSAVPVIENAPTAGAYAGDDTAVRVILQTSEVLPFSSFFMSSPPVIRAEATAAAVTNGEYCVVALESTTAAGITMQGNASVNMGCGLVTNSKAANAVIAGGSSLISATPVAAVGGLQSSGNYASGTALQPYTIAQPDPFADLPEPILPSCSGKVTVQPTATRTLDPGCYRGMDLKGTVTLNPGIYYIEGSSFGVGSQATVIGDGVTIILTSSTAATNPGSIADVNINGGANIQLTAPTSGTYAGVVFYQDRRATDSGTNKINGNASSKIQGAIYMPKQAVEFSGTSGMDTKCLQIVSRRVTFTGNNSITNQCPAGSGAESFTGTRVQLVG